LNDDGILVPERQRLSSILIQFPRVAPLVAFALVLAATMLVAVLIEHSSRVEQRTEVTERVTALAQDLERRVSATQAYLMSGAALFESGMDVDQQTFNRFAATLQADNDFQGIMALGWSVRMAPDQIGAFEKMMRQSRAPGFRAWPQPNDPNARFVDSIKFVAPINADNRNTSGFNLRSEPVRRDAVDRAALSGRPAITGRVRRLQGGDVPGIIMIAPVYEYGGPPGTHSQLKGFITGGMRADRFILASIVGQADSKLDLEVYDQQADPAHLLFRVNHQVRSRRGPRLGGKIINRAGQSAGSNRDAGPARRTDHRIAAAVHRQACDPASFVRSATAGLATRTGRDPCGAYPRAQPSGQEHARQCIIDPVAIAAQCAEP
jgi:CHASE1-domain containing sensor protein